MRPSVQLDAKPYHLLDTILFTKHDPGELQSRARLVGSPNAGRSCDSLRGMRIVSKVSSLFVHPKSYRSRSLQIATLLVLSAAFLLAYGNQYYPMQHWLFFRYLKIWCEVGGFVLSCFTSGWWLLKVMLPESPRLSERMLLAFGVGVLAFYLLMFTAGMLGLFAPALFYTVPICLIGLGLPSVVPSLPRQGRRLYGYLGRLLQPRSTIQVLAALLCVIALLGVYLQVLLPRNAHADSYWYHLPVAEHYIAAGRIVRFAEGWYVGCYPQLASLLYTWAFLSPGDLFSHVVLCEHLDFVLFSVTVIGVSGFAARLLHIRHLPYAGACVFLFPKLFVYDSNVTGNADHILGFWVLLLGVALVRLSTQFARREAVLTGLFTAAAACTKYQACYVIAPATMLVLFLAMRRRRWMVALVWLFTLVLISSTHWLKNIVYYHDPFYPLLNRYLPATPFHAGAAETLEDAYWLPQFAAQGPWLQRIWSSLKASLTFSFIPNDWGFHGQRPVFGSLFTLAIPVLLFINAGKRLLGVFVGTQVGLVVWYLTSHQDRFLQSLLPWMAAATAAVLYLVWRKGVWARLGTGALVTAQIASGLDVYFMQTHMMLADSPIRALTEYLAAAHTGKYAERYVVSPTEEKVAAVLPPDAVLLSHIYQSRLGLGVRVVADGAGWQGAIEYLQHGSPADTADLLNRLGVSHVMRHPDPKALSNRDMAREIVFQRWLALYTDPERNYDDATLAKVASLPRDAALAGQPTRIAVFDCAARASVGIYTPRGLGQGEAFKTLPWDALIQNESDELNATTVIVQKGACRLSPELQGILNDRFAKRFDAGQTSIWLRTVAPFTRPW